MIDVENWMDCLTENLKQAFKNRLLFVGLQGSYQRGEATEQSDIDVMVLLDQVGLEDLERYRTILAGLPCSQLACGFISGRKEFENWPEYELFQLVRGTSAYYGKLEDFTPKLSDEQARQSLKIGASALYHEVCHRFLYEKLEPKCLMGAFKTSFYLLQLSCYLQTGEYIPTKRSLYDKLHGIEKEILSISLNWDASAFRLQEHPAYAYELLLKWAGAILRQEPM